MRFRKPLLFIAFIVAAAVCFAAGYAWHSSDAVPPVAAENAVAQAHEGAPTVVRFGAGAPQLQFLHSEQVLMLPEPLLEPLNGRVAYDENYTARVSSPISGRVTSIEVQLGDRVSKGQPLAWIDAPDYAAASADVAKAQSDVQLKTRANARVQE